LLFCKSGSGPSYERSRPVTSESSFEADEDDDEGRRLEGRLVEQQGRRKESGLRQAKAFTKGSRASRSCGRHFKESQTSVGGKMLIYLPDNYNKKSEFNFNVYFYQQFVILCKSFV
jgi:hypothetical protein